MIDLVHAGSLQRIPLRRRAFVGEILIHTLDLPHFPLDSRTFSERPEDAMYRRWW
ncbi:MAG: hypothetical protein VX911_11505 [Candidatus Latescibacterota bacterium]|nr:hypothetical protein [Candidatus Latescibacterota bacterium]